MAIGDIIRIKAQHPEGGAVFNVDAVVKEKCKKFCVLSNGKYRFCAFYGDLRCGRVIVL